MSKRHIIAVAAVAALVVTAGGTAALTTDTKTATTSTQSDLVADYVVDEPHNDSQTIRVQVEGDSSTNTSSLANPSEEIKFNLTVNDADSEQDGETIYSTTQNWSTEVVSNAPDHYYLNLSADTWGEDLQYGPDQNITVNATIVFNESESDQSVHEIRHYVDPNGSDARLEFADDERTTLGQRGLFGASLNTLGIGGEETDTYAASLDDDITVVDNTSTVTMSVDNGSAVSAWSDVASAGDSGALSVIGVVSAETDDETLIPVFVESADAEWLDTESDTYAVVSSSGESVTVENAGELVDGSETVTFSAQGNEAVGSFRTISMLRSYGAGVTTYATAAGSATNFDGNPLTGDS
jgi:hypothetical protein